MSKTLLLFNGQTVILTNDGSEAVVQGSPALTPTLIEEPHGEAKGLPEVGVGRQHQQQQQVARLAGQVSQSEDMRSSVVEVRVAGREVPGYMVSPEGGTAMHNMMGQLLHLKKDFELLNSDGEEEHEASANNNTLSEGGFLQLPVASLHATAGLEEQQGGSLGREVFTITTDAQLMPPNAEVKDGGCEQEETEGSSGGLQGLASLVQLPLGAEEVKRTHDGIGQEGGQQQGQAKGLSTVVAIIQGDDGTTQTIELSQEEVCRLALPQLLPDTNPLLPLTDASLGAKAGGHHHHLHHPRGAEGEAFTMECSPVFPEGHVGPLVGREAGEVEVEVEREDADVSLGPFLLIPEYNSDGSISNLLQLRGSGSEAVPEAAAAAAVTETQQHSSSVSLVEAKKPAFTLPGTSQSVHKIRLPLLPQVTQVTPAIATATATATATAPRLQSCLRAKVPEQRVVSVAARTAPKVSGNTYLRDMAKRTKFRNLTSFLEAKQDTPGPDEAPVTTVNAAAAAARLVRTPRVAGGHRSLLTPGGVEASARPFTVTSGHSLLRTVPTITSARAVPRPASTPAGQAMDGTLTIRVSTGPINANTTTVSATTTTTTITSTTTSTSMPQPPPPPPPPPRPISSHVPSIKCAEFTEEAGGTDTLAPSDSTSLTSIVYCSSGRDEAPFAVHLPGGDSSKPLGSSENPIQLVQRGNTFQALQPVQERQLEQITTLLQQRRITAPPTSHRDEIYDPKTNMKIVYKVVYPEDVLPEEEEEEEDDEEDEFTGLKEEDEGGYSAKEDPACSIKVEEDVWEAQTTFLEEKRRGRKPKDWRKLRPIQEEMAEEDMAEGNEERKNPVSRTRSGRISRPPRHMVKDFKHLHPVNFNDDAQERDTSSFGYLDYEEYCPPQPEKGPQPVIADLPRRKKREVPQRTRLRYTCATCGKLYMGRIEAHYRKFPDHCRTLPPSPNDPKQSYSAIKTLSDSAKPSGGEGSEINKSVLSPTPGTPASETSGEPGLPMETLTAQPQHQQEPQAPADLPVLQHEPHNTTQQTPARARRGRGRQKGRARRGGRGRPARVRPVSEAVEPPPIKPCNVLEQILNEYTSQEIQSAAGPRLFQNLSPWQLLCQRVDRAGAWPQWQQRLRVLEDLLKECQEDLFSQAEPLPGPATRQEEEEESRSRLHEGDGGGCVTGASGKGDSQPPAGTNQDVLTDREGAAVHDCNAFQSVVKEENSNFEVSDYLAGVFRVTSCEYQLKQPPSSPPSPTLDSPPVPHIIPCRPHTDSPPPLVRCSGGKRSLEDEGDEDAMLPPKKRDMEPESVMSDQPALTATPLGLDITTETGVHISTKKEEFSSTIDCVNSALEAAACGLVLPSYTLHTQLPSGSSSSHPTLPAQAIPAMLTSQPETHLSVTLPHLSSECVVVTNTTTLTTAHPAPYTTPASSLPLEIPSFSSHSTSLPTLSPCLPLTTMDTSSFIPTSTMSQVNTLHTMQQLPLGDMDITAEDLPRLLSEGTGLVVGGSNDGCDAPKLLDTSGDTTDLSEMLFKLQEATASISQSHDNHLGSHMYQESVNGSTPHLLTTHTLHTHTHTHTPGVGLTTHHYGTVGGLNPHHTPNLTLKLDTSQAGGGASMPLLTFSGALNSNFHADSGLGQTVAGSEESSKISAMLSEVSGQQNGGGKEGEGERLSIGFGSANLGISEFEDLLKR